MKSVVITGSARGFGYEMIKLFRNNNFNTVICDIDENALNTAKEELENICWDEKINFDKSIDIMNILKFDKDENKCIESYLSNGDVIFISGIHIYFFGTLLLVSNNKNDMIYNVQNIKKRQ